jgi:CRISPR-associated protein Csh2
MRADDFKKDSDKVLDICIDMRLFGGVIPLDKDSITYTGPVQFQMGRSLHRVNSTYIKGTGAFASKNESKQKTFREEYIIPYSFIAFHGIINPNAGKDTKLTNEDINLLIESMWEGTKNLISRSKFGQMPRLLLKVDYTDNFYIGDLHKLISIQSDLEDEQIRGIDNFTLDVSQLNNKLTKHKDKIASIKMRKDDNLKLSTEIKCEEL